MGLARGGGLSPDYTLFVYIEVDVQSEEQTRLRTVGMQLNLLCRAPQATATPYLVLSPYMAISVHGRVDALLKICINACIMNSEVAAQTYRSSSSYN